MRPRMGLAPGRFQYWVARVDWARSHGQPVVFIDQLEREELDGALPRDALELPITGATLLGYPIEVLDEGAHQQRTAMDAV